MQCEHSLVMIELEKQVRLNRTRIVLNKNKL